MQTPCYLDFNLKHASSLMNEGKNWQAFPFEAIQKWIGLHLCSIDKFHPCHFDCHFVFWHYHVTLITKTRRFNFFCVKKLFEKEVKFFLFSFLLKLELHMPNVVNNDFSLRVSGFGIACHSQNLEFHWKIFEHGFFLPYV